MTGSGMVGHSYTLANTSCPLPSARRAVLAHSASLPPQGAVAIVVKKAILIFVQARIDFNFYLARSAVFRSRCVVTLAPERNRYLNLSCGSLLAIVERFVECVRLI